MKMCGNIFPAYQRNESNTKCVKIKSILGHESSLGKNKMYKRQKIWSVLGLSLL